MPFAICSVLQLHKARYSLQNLQILNHCISSLWRNVHLCTSALWRSTCATLHCGEAPVQLCTMEKHLCNSALWRSTCATLRYGETHGWDVFLYIFSTTPPNKINTVADNTITTKFLGHQFKVHLSAHIYFFFDFMSPVFKQNLVVDNFLSGVNWVIMYTLKHYIQPSWWFRVWNDVAV